MMRTPDAGTPVCTCTSVSTSAVSCSVISCFYVTMVTLPSVTTAQHGASSEVSSAPSSANCA